jgi:hypothetical protein
MSMRDQMTSKFETDAAIDGIEELLRNARPIPLTDQVRLDPDEAKRLLAELREALVAERRARG